MGMNVKEVGGGPSVGLANDFVSWLQNGINSGTFGGGTGPGPSAPTMPSGMNPNQKANWLKDQKVGAQQTAGDNFGRANPVQSTQGAAGVINKFLGGDFGTQNYNTDTSGLTAAGAKPAFDFAAWNPTKTDMSGLDTGALKGFKSGITTGAAPGMIGDNSDFMSGINQLFGMAGGSAANPINQPGSLNFDLGNVDLSPYQALWDRRTDEAIGDTRARFGAAGGASFGTPAAFAEANTRGEMGAQESASMADIGRQQQMLELQRQMGAAQIDAQNFGTWASAMNQGRAIDLQAATAGVSQLAQALGMDQQAMLNVRGQDLQAAIANGQMSLDALVAATGFDAQLIDMALKENLSLQEMFQSYQATQANTAIADKGLNLDSIIKSLAFQQGDNQLNTQNNQFNQSSQMDMINMLMQAFQNMSLPGIAPRQTAITPSAGANILNTASSFAPLIPGYGGKG